QVVEADIRGRIGAAVPSNRRLVDAHDLVDVVGAFDGLVLAGQRARVDQALPQRLIENLVDEGALAGTGCSRDRHQHAERNPDVDVLEIIFTGAADGQGLAHAFAAALGRGDGALAR